MIDLSPVEVVLGVSNSKSFAADARLSDLSESIFFYLKLFLGS